MGEKNAEKLFNIPMTIEAHRELKARAAVRGVTMREYCLDAIGRQMDRDVLEDRESLERFTRILKSRTEEDNEKLRQSNEAIMADPAVQAIEARCRK
jgi:hypothetical protein